MPALENPPENPCFGCGPEHERGLHLTFSRVETEDGPAVEATYTPGEDEIGWPGLMHAGLHFLVLYEACYWAALELGPGVMTQRGPLSFEQPTIPRAGKALVVRGWIEAEPEAGPRSDGGGLYTIAARTTSSGGSRELGSLAGPFAPIERSRVEQAGIPVPGYLLEDMID